jgi:hypothetical protein
VSDVRDIHRTSVQHLHVAFLKQGAAAGACCGAPRDAEGQGGSDAELMQAKGMKTWVWAAARWSFARHLKEVKYTETSAPFTNE